MLFRSNVMDGAEDPGFPSPEAFLGRSCPFENKRGWSATVRRKDHFAFSLQVYAIAIKLHGVSTPVLESHWHMVSKKSTVLTSYPSSTVTLPAGYKLVGGGAETHSTTYYGNHITKSFRYSANSWQATGRDNMVNDFGYITAYAIGIDPDFPGWGTLDVYENGRVVASPSGSQYVTVAPPSGCAPACPSAMVTGTGGQGRMVSSLYVGTDGYATLRSIDGNAASTGLNYITLSGVKKR